MEPTSADTFVPDFIVVGGGTAGMVIASRLTEKPEIRVLVIEAGSYNKGDPKVDIPGFMTQLWGDEKYDWSFMTTPQKALHNRQIPCPRGKMLGGSSGVNFSAIIYPSSADLEAWTKLGNRGWSSRDMEPYFRKSQTFYPPAPQVAEMMQLHSCVDTELQRQDGPLPVCYLDGYGKAQQAFYEKFEELGFNIPGDPIHGKKLGAFSNPMSIDPTTWTRAYTASAYYSEAVAARPNLKIMTNAIVKRVILEESTAGVVAQGVEILNEEGVQEITLKEGGEVILSAGTVKSPQILELSGIGKGEVLSRNNIPVVISNPNVGGNLQDHSMASISFEVEDAAESADIMRDPKNIAKAIEEYQSTRGSPLSGTHISVAYLPLLDGQGRATLAHSKDLIQEHLSAEKHPLQFDILRELLVDQNESASEYLMLPLQINVNATGATDMATFLSPRTEGNYVTLLAMLNRPFSRGSVHIRCADTREHPDFDPCYLEHPLDLEILARHTQFIEKIAGTGSLSKVLKQGGRRIPEGFDLTDLDSTKELVRQRCFTSFHPSSTSAMMPREQGGVVGDRLVVHGTNNLKVVDASIFRIVTSG